MSDVAFGRWIGQLDGALARGDALDVPCGDCTACCRAGQFVHIEPDEHATLARIPGELLFPAPGLPRGHRLLGYDERGHCPLFIDGKCSVYEVRPRACRVYDCRIFTATGVEPDKPEIAARTRQWHFDDLDPRDRAEHEATRAAARFLAVHQRDLPAGAVPDNPTQLAVIAVRIRHLFLAGRPSVSGDLLEAPRLDEVSAELRRLANG